MVYTKFCQCSRILTIEEMDKEKNPSGVCKECQKKHAKEFSKKFKELGNKPAK